MPFTESRREILNRLVALNLEMAGEPSIAEPSPAPVKKRARGKPFFVIKEVEGEENNDPAPSQPGHALPVQPDKADTPYSLFRCTACGKRVLGFDRENHVRQVHPGKGVKFEKIQ